MPTIGFDETKAVRRLIHSTGLRRWFATSSAALSAFTGVQSEADLAAETTILCAGKQWCWILPFSDGDEDDTYSIDVELIYEIARHPLDDRSSPASTPIYLAFEYTALACTVGTVVGEAGEIIVAADTFAKTIVATDTAFATFAGTVTGKGSATSTTDPACYAIRDLMNAYAIRLRPNGYTGVTAANALVSFDT